MVETTSSRMTRGVEQTKATEIGMETSLQRSRATRGVEQNKRRKVETETS